MNFVSFCRSSYGIQSSVSTAPPPCTYSRNCSSLTAPPNDRSLVFHRSMPTRRNELTRQAARLFAERGYHGTSIGDLAKAMGVQKGSLYAHISSKEDLLYETMREGADAFHAVLDAIPDGLPATEKIRLALRGHLRVVAEQLD